MSIPRSEDSATPAIGMRVTRPMRVRLWYFASDSRRKCARRVHGATDAALLRRGLIEGVGTGDGRKQAIVYRISRLGLLVVSAWAPFPR